MCVCVCVCVCVCLLVAWSCPTLCDLWTVRSPPGSSVHGLLFPALKDDTKQPNIDMDIHIHIHIYLPEGEERSEHFFKWL